MPTIKKLYFADFADPTLGDRIPKPPLRPPGFDAKSAAQTRQRRLCAIGGAASRLGGFFSIPMRRLENLPTTSDSVNMSLSRPSSALLHQHIPSRLHWFNKFMQGPVKLSTSYVCLRRLLCALLTCVFAASGWSATFTVTSTANSGPGSFFAAITNANATAGLDMIVFQIAGSPPFVISPTAALPGISDAVVIDATTQPGFGGKPVVELNGSGTSGSTIGLRFTAGASTLRGMAINHFPVQLIELDSASNSIQGNFIGTDTTGTVARGNGVGCSGIVVKSAGNLIGGSNSGDGNVISGGNDTGIYLLNANNNVVQGNLIGVNAAGTGSLGNLNDGIIIYGSSGNLIGGPVSQARNIISGNGFSGVYLTGSAGNVIQGNRIGTDISGSNILSNVVGDGISLISSPGNLISSNLISGNGLAGVSITGPGANGNQLLGNFLGTDVNGKVSLGNHLAGVAVSGANGTQIGGLNAGDGNVISGNVQDGIKLTGGATANIVQGNLIGVSATGNKAVRNTLNGITISGSSSNFIGGLITGARNIISGNSINGVAILLPTDSGNNVQGNYIGSDTTGIQPIANLQSGVRIQGSFNIIGGSVAGAGNLISGNTHQGIWLVGTNGNATGNTIQGNWIGLNAAGAGGLGNGINTGDSAGIGISTAAANLVGGPDAGAGNVISANVGAGIFLVGPTTTSNILQGNFIGTDASGTLGQGNAIEGIYLETANANLIGGSTSGAGNLISANFAQGIYLWGASSNSMQGNFIGTAIDGASGLGNRYHGIELQTNANNNIIGGSAAGAGNRLAFASIGASSVYCGVRVRTGSVNNLISGNSIFGNGALGIDLSPTDGSTAAGFNPIVDCESGVATSAANAGQNFPTLTTAYSGASTRIRGTMDGKTGKTYTLQFFASPTGDSTGYGEGQVYLGQTNVTLGASCSSNFTANLPVSVLSGWVISATATGPANNTSEFSAWVPVIPIPPVQLTVPNAGQLSISWSNNGGSFILQRTFSLMPPVIWAAVTNLPALLNNLMVTTLDATNASVFYRLTAP